MPKKEKKIEEKLVDALGEIAKKPGLGIFQVMEIMVRHLDGDIKNISLSGSKRVAIMKPHERN